jgi:hypothetical protein
MPPWAARLWLLIFGETFTRIHAIPLELPPVVSAGHVYVVSSNLLIAFALPGTQDR